MYGSRNGDSDTVEQLLRHPEIDANIADSENQTALTIAAIAGHKEIVRFLLGHPGLDLDAAGEDVLSAVEKNGYSHIANMLRFAQSRCNA